MVSAQNSYLNSGVHNLADMGKSPEGFPGDDIRVFKPEFEKIAVDDEMSGAIGYFS